MKNGIGPHSGFLELVYGLCASVLIPCRQNDGDAAAGRLASGPIPLFPPVTTAILTNELHHGAVLCRERAARAEHTATDIRTCLCFVDWT
jgi:hypothetical protein